MINNFKDPKITSLIASICNEHYKICKVEDSNMGYLWHMYAIGSKKDTFRPFIFLSELNLLVKKNYLSMEEKDNLARMLRSTDDDNAHLTAYSIITLRNKRIAELGVWTLDNPNYKDVNYTKDIIHVEMFLPGSKDF
jgi:hypothetical protein